MASSAPMSRRKPRRDTGMSTPPLTKPEPGGFYYRTCRNGLVSGGAEHAHDRGGDPAPFAFFVRQLAAAGPGQRVEARLPVVLGRAPFGADEPAVFQPLERGIERSVIDDQHVARLRLDRARDPLAV